MRTAADARLLLVPIHEWAVEFGVQQLAVELDEILAHWGDPAFDSSRAIKLLDELDWELMELDCLELGEIRVPLGALEYAIERQQELAEAVDR